MKRICHYLILFFLFGMFSPIPVFAGRWGLAGKGVKKLLLKATIKELVENAGKEFVKKRFRSKLSRISANGAKNIEDKIEKLSIKTDRKATRIAENLIKYGAIYVKASYAEDAIAFGIRNSEAGPYLLDRFGYDDLNSAEFTGSNHRDAVDCAWRICNKSAIGGSILKFKKKLREKHIPMDSQLVNKIFSHGDNFSQLRYNRFKKQ